MINETSKNMTQNEKILKRLQTHIANGSAKCRRYDGSDFDFGTESGCFGIYIYDNDDLGCEFFMADDLNLNKFEVEIV